MGVSPRPVGIDTRRVAIPVGALPVAHHGRHRVATPVAVSSARGGRTAGGSGRKGPPVADAPSHRGLAHRRGLPLAKLHVPCGKPRSGRRPWWWHGRRRALPGSHRHHSGSSGGNNGGNNGGGGGSPPRPIGIPPSSQWFPPRRDPARRRALRLRCLWQAAVLENQPPAAQQQAARQRHQAGTVPRTQLHGLLPLRLSAQDPPRYGAPPAAAILV